VAKNKQNIKESVMQGKITITKDKLGFISIVIMDDSSYQEFIEIKLNKEVFADALLGSAYMPCSFETKQLELIGKKITTEEVIIELDNANDQEEALQKIAELSEKDSENGWEYLSLYDFGLHPFFCLDGKHYVRAYKSKYI
jgi:hypothetical protein